MELLRTLAEVYSEDRPQWVRVLLAGAACAARAEDGGSRAGAPSTGNREKGPAPG